MPGEEQTAFSRRLESNPIDQPNGTPPDDPGPSRRIDRVRDDEISVEIDIDDGTEQSALTHSTRLLFGASGSHTRARGNGATANLTHSMYESFENSGIVIHPENEIEAQRMSNNYKFGFKKWKSHVTSRPMSTRSEIVQDLYSDNNKIKPSRILTCRPFNIVYTLVFGWWLSLIYVLIAAVMFITIIGKDYGYFCMRMAKYFLWPFGKFVHQVHHFPLHSVARTYKGLGENGVDEESRSLLRNGNNTTLSASLTTGHSSSTPPPSIWKRPQTYVWLLLGIPVLWPVHALIWGLSWFFVITIPVAKLNSKMMLRILFLAPKEVQVEDQSVLTLNPQKRYSEIVMYSHQAVNFYYYKLTVDGVNVILVNLTLFVALSITLGYADENNVIIDPITKCVLAVLAIVPLTYYVGMAITSISAQSSFAVGAILNATFGSMVELILFFIMLKKGKDSGQACYAELVRSSLTGTILVSILFIPGISMVMGGIKFRAQNFNPKSASVSAALLFVSIAGIFSPTIFSQIYGHQHCQDCVTQMDLTPLSPMNQSSNTSIKTGYFCRICTQSVFGPNGDRTLYDQKVAPLVYCCAIILPIAYIVGLIFSMKTHNFEVYTEFETQLKEDLKTGQGHSHGSAQWSRIKSIIILMMCATCITLCGDIISNNIQPLLEKSGLSEYFIGVTMLAIVAELPEVVNGIQFALQNNVNLGIEIGSSTAIQVCLVQIPILVLIDVIYPMGFHLIFAEIHFWTVIFSVIVINYIFQDGKSDYFQGIIVVFIYLLLMVMYVFTIPPDDAVCISVKADISGNSTVPPTNHLMFGEL